MDELHVEISALAPPAEAHARIAYALAEVKKYLIPDTNDMIRQNQMREIMDRGKLALFYKLLFNFNKINMTNTSCSDTNTS